MPIPPSCRILLLLTMVPIVAVAGRRIPGEYRYSYTASAYLMASLKYSGVYIIQSLSRFVICCCWYFGCIIIHSIKPACYNRHQLKATYMSWLLSSEVATLCTLLSLQARIVQMFMLMEQELIALLSSEEHNQFVPHDFLIATSIKLTCTLSVRLIFLAAPLIASLTPTPQVELSAQETGSEGVTWEHGQHHQVIIWVLFKWRFLPESD